jgi:hypothetical protein
MLLPSTFSGKKSSRILVEYGLGGVFLTGIVNESKKIRIPGRKNMALLNNASTPECLPSTFLERNSRRIKECFR